METAIRGVLIPLNELRAQYRLTPERFLSYLNEEISHQAEEEWKRTYLERWQTVGTYLAALLEPGSYFSTLGKAFDLLANRPAVTIGFKDLEPTTPCVRRGGHADTGFAFDEYAGGQLSRCR